MYSRNTMAELYNLCIVIQLWEALKTKQFFNSDWHRKEAHHKSSHEKEVLIIAHLLLFTSSTVMSGIASCGYGKSAILFWY